LFLKLDWDMSNFLSKDEADEIKRAANERILLLRGRGSNRHLGHLVQGTGNYAIQKGDCERAIAALHRTHDTGISRQIRKVVKVDESDAARAIALMHTNRSFANQTIPRNCELFAKLGATLLKAATKDFVDARQAKRALKKMIG
jgi:hypothetical protein